MVIIFTKDKGIIIISIVVGLIVSISATTKNYSDKIQSSIADKVIRFHVLANSDSETDQNLKLEVRDAVLQKYGQDMSNCNNIEESRQFLRTNIQDIQEYADGVIREKGFPYETRVSLQNVAFPTKYYDGLSFPPGQYEALRIEIGEAQGENWWCVMFPPLCFVDITQAKTTEINQPLNKETNFAEETNDKILVTKENRYAVDKSDSEETQNSFDSTKADSQTEKNNTKLVSEENTNDKKAIMSEGSNEILRASLSEEEYDLVTKNDSDIKVKFKIVEFWQNAKNNSIF